MPRKKHSVKSTPRIAGIREEPSSMHQFESVVEYMQRRSFLNFITSGFFDVRTPLFDPMFDGDYHSYPHSFTGNGLRPHPRIRELAEEEAEKHARELIEEEKRCKEKTEKNRRKKLRKKEKRLEKQNAAKALLHDEEGNSENQEEEEDFIESDGEKNGPVESVETEKETVEKEETSEDKQEEEKSVMTAEEEDVEIKSPVDPSVEEVEKRSRELAGIGCRFAASEQYEKAVQYFTDAIKCNPRESKFFGNRSLCYERMQQYENACRDADVALSIKPKWIKGLFRKGKALCGLKRYYEASLIYREVIELDSSRVEAKEELKQAQTLHLMEMGFSWAESSKALKTHTTMEEAIESLFNGGEDTNMEDTGQAAAQEEDDSGDDEEWITQRSSRHRAQRAGESVDLRRFGPSPTPRSGSAAKAKLFPVWVGVLAPSVTYDKLHQLFSRVGTVYRIKMLLEQQCAFVNYTREEDCDSAVQCFNGKVLEGAPLMVRYPAPTLNESCRSKECFFWRTTGCTRSDCIYKHDPNHRGIDRDKFTSGLGNFHT